MTRTRCSISHVNTLRHDFPVSFPAIENDEDIQMIEEEISALTQSNKAEEDRVDQLRSEISDLELQIRQAETETASLTEKQRDAERTQARITEDLVSRLKTLTPLPDIGLEAISLETLEASVKKLSTLCSEEKQQLPENADLLTTLRNAVSSIEIV